MHVLLGLLRYSEVIWVEVVGAEIPVCPKV